MAVTSNIDGWNRYLGMLPFQVIVAREGLNAPSLIMIPPPGGHCKSAKASFDQAVKELQNCAVFQSVVVEWANSAGLSNSDAFEGDALDTCHLFEWGKVGGRNGPCYLLFCLKRTGQDIVWNAFPKSEDTNNKV